VENSLPLWSEKYGLYGVADTVEFEGDKIIPVEFKSGKKKKKLADDIQLAAQAICLEEMFSKEITSGYIYYDKSRKRREVVLDEKLRKKLTDTISSVRELLISKNTPQPVNDQRCNNCSLKDYCLPDLAGRIENYLKELK
jgi:CRISPR-associated exonuclease Cas4